MSGPRFAHLTGRPMWEHCDHVGTRIEGTPAAVVLAPATGATDGAPPPASPADYAAWLAGYGSAVILPCAPDQCDGAQVLLAAPGQPMRLLTPAGWLPLPTPAAAPPMATPGLEFTPLDAPPAPAGADAIALDPAGRCWLLDRAGRRLLALNPQLGVLAVVPLPPDIDPGGFACSAVGLVVADRSQPRVVMQPWGGAWRGHAAPAGPGRRIVSITAHPAWQEAIALIEGGPDRW